MRKKAPVLSVLVVGDDGQVAAELRLLGFKVACVQIPEHWRHEADVLVVAEPTATVMAGRAARESMPHLPCCVVAARPLSVVERCALYDAGVQHVLEPPWLGVELAARLRATRVGDRRRVEA